MDRSLGTPTRRSFVIGLATAFAAAAAGCNEQLHEHASVLLDAWASGDTTSLLAIASPGLRDDLDAEKFAQDSAQYGMLGELLDRTRTGFGTFNDGRTLDYRLEFEKGELTLYVRDDGEGHLDGFELKGSAWKDAAKALRQRRLEQMLDAIERRDEAAAQALCHDSVPAEQVSALVAKLAPLGKARTAEFINDGPQGIAVTFEETVMAGKLEMWAGKITAFGLHPKDA